MPNPLTDGLGGENSAVLAAQLAVVAAARSLLGAPYVWAGEGPGGDDCSGLCQWSYAQIGIAIPRTSQEQAQAGVPVAYSDLQPGDLVIIYPDASHVVLYSGNGMCIDASTFGVPVEEVPLSSAGPYNQARRFIQENTVTITGIDYAGGRPPADDIAAAGYQFVCRYLSDGGPSLPGKLLIPSEVNDLQSHGIEIVSNWETTGATAIGGYASGVADAQAAWATHTSLGGPPNRPIYFSMDWDEAPDQDTAIFAYFQGVASVIGLENTGAYGGYWPLSRLLDAGLITYAWQTQAWSGGNQDPRINILQDNNAGYAWIDGVECDIDYALTDDYGQWGYKGGTVTQPTDPTLAAALDNQEQLRGPGLNGWPQLGGHTVVDALAAIGQKLGIEGFNPPGVSP